MSKRIYPAPARRPVTVINSTDDLLDEIVDLISIDIIGLRGQLNRGVALKARAIQNTARAQKSC